VKIRRSPPLRYHAHATLIPRNGSSSSHPSSVVTLVVSTQMLSVALSFKKGIFPVFSFIYIIPFRKLHLQVFWE
jgi:hypothetical protein